MKRFLVMMLAIVGVLFATSCSDDEDENSLTLSKTAFEFEQGASNTEVTVTTDVENWFPIKSADWIELEVKDDKLIIKVAENKTLSNRKDKILVIAGNVNAAIEVTQKAAKGDAVINPENVVLQDFKGVKMVEVIANDKNWTAKTDADWLTLTAKPYKSELWIKHAKNEKIEDRTAKITLTIGGIDKVIEVRQNGLQFYLLPYMNFSGDFEDVTDFEAERRNKFAFKMQDSYIFDTRSALFNMIYYIIKDTGTNYIEAKVYVKDAALFKEKRAEFNSFLVKKGFVKEKEDVYFNSEYSVRASISDGLVVYRYIPVQKGDYSTFKKFPYIDLNWGDTNENVANYEKKHKGTFNENNSIVDNPEQPFDLLEYDVEADNDEIPYLRQYVVGKKGNGKLKEGLVVTTQFFKKLELAFFEVDGKYAPTKEFIKLAENEGFTYIGGPDNLNAYNFIKESTNTGMSVTMSKDGKSFYILMNRLDLKVNAVNENYTLSYFKNIIVK